MLNGGSKGMTILTKKQSDFVEGCMEDLFFVQWDRFIVFFEDSIRKLKVYGWIDREKDSYKDFVLLEILLDTLAVNYATSSDAYTKEISNVLFGDAKAHENCKRIESMFKARNCVRLNGDVGQDNI